MSETFILDTFSLFWTVLNCLVMTVLIICNPLTTRVPLTSNSSSYFEELLCYKNRLSSFWDKIWSVSWDMVRLVISVGDLGLHRLIHKITIFLMFGIRMVNHFASLTTHISRVIKELKKKPNSLTTYQTSSSHVK